MQDVKRTEGITICIPNWNHRDFLFRSVGCALQAARALVAQGIGCEVLVVDDCSRDGSQRLLLRLAMLDHDGLLHVISHDENRGLGATRNHGLAASRYKWICFLDADNELVPENLVYFYRAAKDTSAAFVYGNIMVKMRGGHGELTQLLSHDFLHDGIFERNYIDAMAVVDAEQILSVGGYVESRTMAEDLELVLHLVAENRSLVLLPMLLGYWYSNSLSLGAERGAVDNAKIERMYNQRGTGLPLTYQPRMYHPDLGYLV